MNGDLNQQIDLYMNAQPAIKVANEAGKDIEQALTIDAKGDPYILAQQKALKENVGYAKFLNEYIRANAIKTKEIALSEAQQVKLQELESKAAEQTAQAKQKQLRVEELAQNLKNRQEEDPEHRYKYIDRAQYLLEGAQTAAANVNAELANTVSQIEAIKSAQYEITPNFEGVADAIQEYGAEMLKNSNIAEQIIERNEYLEGSVKKVAAAEASSMEEFEGITEALNATAEAQNNLGDAETPNMEWVSKTADSASNVSEAMQEIKIAEQSVSEGANNADNDISRLIKRIAELKSDINAVESGKKSASVEQYRAMNIELRESQNLLKAYRGQLEATATKTRKTSGDTKGASRAMRRFSEDVKQTIKNLGGFKHSGNVFAKMSSHINSMQSSMKHLRSSFKRGFSNFTKYILGFKSFYYLVRRLRKFIVEGLENLAQYNDKVNKNVKSHNLFNDAMNELKTSLLYLKNAWAAAFAPIVIYVMPVLTGLIDYLAVAGNALARFIAKLTGQENAYNALKVQAQDYADSLDKAGDSAKKNSDKQKKLNQSLADYDKLLVIAQKNDTDDSPNNGSGSGANVYTPNVQDMFTVADSADSFAQSLLDAFSEGGWAELGTTIAEKFATAFDNIPWTDIKTKVGKNAKDLGDFVNGFFGDTNMWDSFGVAAGGALNTVTIALREFLDPIDTFKIGWSASSGLRHFLTTVDWKGIGSNINTAWTKITDGLKGFLDNFPTEETAKAILDFIEGINIPQVVQTGLTVLVKGLVKVVEIAQQVIVQGAENLANKLVVDVSTVKISRYTTIDQDGTVQNVDLQIKPDVDWTEHPIMALIDQGFTDLGEFTMQIITGGDYDTLLTFMDFFTQEVEVPQWLYDLAYNFEFPSLDDFVKNCQDLIEIWAEDFTTGNLFSILTWLEGFLEEGPVKKLDELQESFNEWITGTFSQEDLTKWAKFGSVMQTIGQYLLEGTFTGGILPAIDTVKQYFNDPEFKKKIDDNPIVKTVKGIGEAIGQSFKDPLGTVKTALFDEKKGIMKYFTGDNSIVKKIKQKLGLGDNNTIGIVGALKKAFTNPLGAIKDALFSTKTGLMQYFSGDGSIIKKIKDKLEGSGILDAFKKAFNFSSIFEQRTVSSKLKDSQKTLWEKLFGYKVGSKHINGLLDDLKDKFVSIWTGIKSGIKSPIKSILGMIENVVNACIDGINWLLKKAGSITIAGKPILPSNWTNPLPDFVIDYKAIGLAQGAVIPPNREFLAVLGDQKSGTNIETPLATMIEAFKQALNEDDGNRKHEPIVLQLDGRVVAQVVWDEEDKKYKQTGFGLAY